MTFDTVEIEFENGRRRTFPSSDFDYYAGTNELEHKSENIIISLSSLEKSFVYEMDEVGGEMVNKEYITRVEFH